MPTQERVTSALTGTAFPAFEVERRLRKELQEVADDAQVLRPDWEPLLDSKRVVGTVLAIEDLFPSVKIPPDKVVRKGGYFSVEDAVSDMLARIEQVVSHHNTLKRAR
jgi:hypothetical protein